ncbi:unnamed protein product [Closterium sp. NIES-64]|nr:unnamed protein product [Closterium sp. NIES-65]CAI5994466.1 unnamed protein product [Closterium sp. NIES-64]
MVQSLHSMAHTTPMRRLSRRLSLLIGLLLTASPSFTAQNVTSPDPTNGLGPAADARPVSASAVGTMGDEEGFYMEETPAIKQLVARLERIAGSIKNPWEVLLHLNELFPASAGGGGRIGTQGVKSPLAEGCPATAAQMTKEVSRLAWRLHFRPIKYTIMARFFRNLANNARAQAVCVCAEKNNADLTYLGCRTYFIPSNFALMNVIAKGAGDVRYLLLAPLYNIINGTYHFDKLRRLPHGATMPTFIPDYPIAKYFTPITPLALITFGGSIVAVGTPGAKTIFARLSWAQIKDRDIHCGKYLAAHGVSTMVIPRVKLNN